VTTEIQPSGKTFLRALQQNTCRTKAAMLRRSRDEHGSTLVEMALSVTMLLTLIIGVMIMCLALYSYHTTSEAARLGLRYVMVRGSSCTTYGNFASDCPVTTSTQVRTYVRGLTLPGIDPTNLEVTVTWPTTGSTCTPSLSPCNNPGNLVMVRVTYTLPLSIPFVSAQTLTMSSTAETVIAD
jgi:hypothetical protein